LASDLPFSNRTRTLNAEGSQGVPRFFLQRIAGGLHVEREDPPQHGIRFQVALQFHELECFKQWCDSEPVRFENPLLYLRLKRDAEDLWQCAVGGSTD
jgi:hypothetical protein